MRNSPASARWRRGPVLGSFHYHYARLIEILFGLERIGQLLDSPLSLGSDVLAHASRNRLRGIGMSEAPRGTLFHDYTVDENGLLTSVDLLIATGQNNIAMNRAVAQIARAYVDHDRLTEGILNRVEAGIRAFDPCLSCSTHAAGMMPITLELLVVRRHRAGHGQQDAMTLVIGYGNPLRGDDGAGPAVAEQIRGLFPGIRVITPHQLLPELADTIARADLVVFVDAALGATPGAVRCDPVRPGPEARLDHVLTPAALLRLTSDAFGCEPPSWLVRVQGQSFGVGRTLSGPVAGAVPAAVELIQSLIPAG